MGLYTLENLNFDQNKLTSLNLCGNFLKSIPILDLPNLQKLDLSSNQLTTTRNVLLCDKLRELSFARNRVTNCEHMETLTELIFLDLRFNKLKNIAAIRNLSFNSKLQVLLIEGNSNIDGSTNKDNSGMNRTHIGDRTHIDAIDEENEGDDGQENNNNLNNDGVNNDGAGGTDSGASGVLASKTGSKSRGDPKNRYWIKIFNIVGPSLRLVDTHTLQKTKLFAHKKKEHIWERPVFHRCDDTRMGHTPASRLQSWWHWHGGLGHKSEFNTDDIDGETHQVSDRLRQRRWLVEKAIKKWQRNQAAKSGREGSSASSSSSASSGAQNLNMLLNAGLKSSSDNPLYSLPNTQSSLMTPEGDIIVDKAKPNAVAALRALIADDEVAGNISLTTVKSILDSLDLDNMAVGDYLAGTKHRKLMTGFSRTPSPTREDVKRRLLAGKKGRKSHDGSSLRTNANLEFLQERDRIKEETQALKAYTTYHGGYAAPEITKENKKIKTRLQNASSPLRKYLRAMGPKGRKEWGTYFHYCELEFSILPYKLVFVDRNYHFETCFHFETCKVVFLTNLITEK